MKRRILASILALMMALSLAACGGSAKTESAASAPMAPAMAEESKMEMGYTSSTSAGGAVMDSAAKVEEQEQKLIRTAYLEMETTAFDDAVEAMAAITEQLGGYYENNSMTNRKTGARWAESMIRIPADRLEEFLSHAGELCHITWQELRQEDVSEAYYDTEGRLKTQQIKLERLQELLSKAEKMEDVITIESAISETEWNIENLSGTLRRYDGLVDYATVHVTLQEVYKLSNVEDVPDSFASRMASAFERGIENFIDTLEDIAVDLAYGWIWWVLFIAVTVIVVRVAKKKGPRGPKLPKLRRRKAKEEPPQE